MKQKAFSFHGFYVVMFWVMLLGISTLSAQINMNYSFQTSTGTYTEITGGTVLGSNSNNDQSFNAKSLGYTFYFGTAAYTQISINSDGYIGMGASVANSYTALSSGLSNYIIAALNCDLKAKTDGELRWETIGTTPNRETVIQWKHYQRNATDYNSDDLNFQIRLKESTNDITFCYGTNTISTGVAGNYIQVGLRYNNATNFMNRTTATDWSATTEGTVNTDACDLNETVYPVNGLVFTWDHHFRYSVTGTVHMEYDQSLIEGGTVTLYSGSSLVETAVTNSSGQFTFPSVIAGNYWLIMNWQQYVVDDTTVAIFSNGTQLTLNQNLSQNLIARTTIGADYSSDMTFLGSYNNHIYWRSNYNHYWGDVNSYAVSRGGHLAVITDSLENRFLTNSLQLHNDGNTRFWFGYRGDEQGPHWENGEPLVYTNWASGQPDGGGWPSGYGNFEIGGTWYDDYYYNWWPYLLEFDTPLGQNPRPVTQLDVQQTRNFGITLSWVNPTKTVSGLYLNNTGETVKIKRDGVLIASFNNITPGGALNWTDNIITGLVHYAVYVENTWGISDSVTYTHQFGLPVQGVAHLEGMTDHSGIKVLFQADPDFPGAVTDSTYTNSDGFYSINLQGGRYDIFYTKSGYLYDRYLNFDYEADRILPQRFLESGFYVMSLNGNVSGTIPAGYKCLVESNITVPADSILTIEPGVTFYFSPGTNMDVYGYLIANGTVNQPIKFSARFEETWNSVIVRTNLSEISYCEFSKSLGYGLQLLADIPVTNCKFYNNDSGIFVSGAALSNAVISNCDFYGNTQRAIYIASYSTASFFDNNIYNNTGNNETIHIENYCFLTFQNNIINTNSASGHLLYITHYNTIFMDYNNIQQNYSGSYLIHFETGNDLQFIGNNIQGNNGSNLFVNDNWGEFNNLNISNNVIIANECRGGWVLHNYGSRYTTIDKNIIANNNGNGIYFIRMGAFDKYVTNNTIVNNSGRGLYFSEWWEGSEELYVVNNISAFNGSYQIGIDNYDAYRVHFLYNDFYCTTSYWYDGASIPNLFLDTLNTNINGTVCDPYNNIKLNPELFAISSGNVNLLATSPCINAGDPTLLNDPDYSICDIGALYFDLIASQHAQIQLPSYTHNFQAVTIGNVASWMCPIYNSGTDPLIVSSVEMNAPFTLQQSTRTSGLTRSGNNRRLSIPVSLTIQPNQTGYLTVNFTPTTSVTYLDTLKIHSNALLNPVARVNLFGTGVLAPDVVLNMPAEDTVNVNTEFSLPLSITNTSGLNILGFNMAVTYDSTKYEYLGITTTGCLTQTWSVFVNHGNAGVQEILYIGASGVTPLSGAGNLIKLNFKSKYDIEDGTVTYFTVNDVIMNEGGIDVQSCYGSIVIRNIIYGDIDNNHAVQAYDAALTLQYSVMMDPIPTIDLRPWIDWRFLRADVSGDGHIYAYDASLILQYVVGLITAFPVETARNYEYENPEQLFEITAENGLLNVLANDAASIYSCNLEIPILNDLTFQEVSYGENTQDWIKASNVSNNVFHVALARAAETEGAYSLFNIPFTLSQPVTIPVKVVINDDEIIVNVSFMPLGNSDVTLPKVNSVSQNYPNPFNPDTHINLALKSDASVSVYIYNVKGQKVKTLQKGSLKAGYHTLTWNGKDDQGKNVSSGIYFYRTEIGNNFKKTYKMLMMK